jgi:hypothetical protein
VVGGWYSTVAYRINRDETDLKNLKLYLSISPHDSKKWEDKKVLHKLVKSCPSQEAFERAWATGDMDFPDVEVGPPDVVNTSAVDQVISKQSTGSIQVSNQSNPSSLSNLSNLSNLSSKQKMEVKRKQQRLMRKAK